MITRSQDLRLRVFLLALEPALQLARALSLELDDIQDAVAGQYVLIYRDRGLSLEQISRRIGKSRRTVVSLARHASELARRLESNRRMTTRRQLATLAASKPRSPAELLKVCGSDNAAAELETLLEEGWLEEHDGIVRAAKDWIPFDGPEDDARLSSVRHFLGAVTATLSGRFFRAPPDPAAMAKVLTFSCDLEMLEQARDALYQHMSTLARELDASAPQNATQVSMAFCVAPIDSKG